MTSDRGRSRRRPLVIATGGLSIPKMGASGFGYGIARQFGLDVCATRAGLVPFTFTGAFARGDAAPVRRQRARSAVTAMGTDVSREYPVHASRHERTGGAAAVELLARRRVIDIDLLPGIDAALLLHAAKSAQPRAAPAHGAGRVFCPGPWLPNLQDHTLAPSMRIAALAGHASNAVLRDDRRHAQPLAASNRRHRGLPNCRGDARRRRHRRIVVEDHGVAAPAGALLHRRGRRRDRPPRRFQFPVGLPPPPI